ncbi:hypothetical protein [Streptomyces mirabilis]|uniref:hypothetical protein n=1 Tax=Streptomyces mirabilis TaxID=68239 RepID=UPI0036AEA1A8
MARNPRPTHCARCGNKLKRQEIPRAKDGGPGPETWCWGCCAAADENGEGGMSTYAVAVMGYSPSTVPPE